MPAPHKRHGSLPSPHSRASPSFTAQMLRPATWQVPVGPAQDWHAAPAGRAEHRMGTAAGPARRPGARALLLPGASGRRAGGVAAACSPGGVLQHAHHCRHRGSGARSRAPQPPDARLHSTHTAAATEAVVRAPALLNRPMLVSCASARSTPPPRGDHSRSGGNTPCPQGERCVAHR